MPRLASLFLPQLAIERIAGAPSGLEFLPTISWGGGTRRSLVEG